ncbi:Uncharacterized protein BXIN_2943 [Babesia sp. Xinjiang]|uniref:Uncharacterized protein n=1 Tax=Babesia sp. Xinjiang TaxID=462227 RepID=UPI000A2282B2|nr:Uncharacterized protein BXIN_2943 [Babesia sp. Xinjiang]ORM39340.1 Uncharacterized protein BXIN_2943 [Babesia sp. Xinjiang]
MDMLDSDSTLSSETFLSTCSLDDIIAHSLRYEADKDISELKDTENVSLVYHFLRHIWTSMTDASVYTPLEGVADIDGVIPFLHSSISRQQVAERILDFLSHFREDSSDDGTGDGDNTVSSLRNVAQGHLLTSFKVLSSYLLSGIVRGNGMVSSSYGILCLAEVYMYMIPAALDLSLFLDLLTDLVKGLPIEGAKALCQFLYERTTFLRNAFKSLEASATSTRLVQTAGAKMIGLVRVLEGILGESADCDIPVQVFNTRITMTSCLPISHLGVCNRQSFSAYMEPVRKGSLEEWKSELALTLRKRAHGISPFELSNYEAIAGNVGFPNSVSGDIFDVKSLIGSSNDRSAVMQSLQHIPSYTVYCDYCDLLNFIFNPLIITDKTQEYMESLHSQFQSVANHILMLAEKVPRYEQEQPWVMPLTTNISFFISRCASLSFWTTFLSASSLAVQSLKISHKRTAPTESIYSLLRDKSAASLDAIERILSQCTSKVSGLSSTLERLLSREKEWILWKQRGCVADPLRPITTDVLTSPGEPALSDSGSDESYMLDFVEMLSELESLSYVGEDGLPELGSNLSLSIDDLKLNRQATAWYLENRATEGTASSASERLSQKLDDYVEKMRMDADPENGIEESEHSKYDPMFRFRFNRLFAGQHVQKYMELSNEDIASGSLECLAESLSWGDDYTSKKNRKREKS